MVSMGCCMRPASAIHAIGHVLAVANGLAPRHGTKHVDRLLSNPKLMRQEVARCWVRFVVAKRKALFVNFDWTELEASDQSMWTEEKPLRLHQNDPDHHDPDHHDPDPKAVACYGL
jgi:hypothetical protein